MQSNIVLIDFESVQPDSLLVLAAETFKVKLFVGATQAKLPFDLVSLIQEMGERAQYVKIAGVGRNALDFHIAYYIGRLAIQEPDAIFHIISKDSGYDPLIQHLKANKINCSRWQTAHDIPVVRASNVKLPTEQSIVFVNKLLQLKVAKPKTEKALRNAISAHFQQQLSDNDILGVIEALEKPGHISLVNGKVHYPNPE